MSTRVVSQVYTCPSTRYGPISPSAHSSETNHGSLRSVPGMFISRAQIREYSFASLRSRVNVLRCVGRPLPSTAAAHAAPLFHHSTSISYVLLLDPLSEHHSRTNCRGFIHTLIHEAIILLSGPVVFYFYIF